MRSAALIFGLAALAGFGAVAALLPGTHVHAAEAAAVKAIVDQLATQYMCQCGCGLTLASCQHPVCGPRDRMLAEIRRLVEAGKSREQITAALVAQYGEQVLAAPPRRGLNLLAWWGPYAAILAGGVSILLLAAAWTRRPSAHPAPTTTALSPEERQLLDDELRKLDA